MKRKIALLVTLALLLTAVLVPQAGADTYATATVKGGWLRLRAGASMQSETISAYYTGTVVTILGGSGSWYQVATPDGKTGYMHADFLTITGSITGGQLPENTSAWVTSANGLSVRLRSGPSKSYSTIASYAVGTPLTILTSGDTWCRVRINGRTGYMMTDFITVTAASTPSGSYTAYVTSANGLGVRMRSGAGKSYSTVATYSVGTQVTVLEYGRTWSRIRVGTLTGYMMTEFLSTNMPSVVTAAALSDSAVWPGETLRVTVSPSGANVKYEWLNDQGVRLGTSSTYTVKNSDAGRRIRCRVTGKNGTAGTAVSGWASVQGNGNVSVGYALTGVSVSDTTPTVGQTLTVTLRPSGATADVSWFREDGVYVGGGSSYTVHPSDQGVRLYAFAQGTGATSGSATSSLTSAVSAGSSAVIVLERVTISDTTPTVGQTLTASVSPSGATVNYIWHATDGRVLGYGGSYTVTAADVGHSIYVYANGVGSTSGSVVSSVTGTVQSAAQSMRISGVTLSDDTPAVGQTLTCSVSPNGATAFCTWYRDDDLVLGYGSSYTVTADDAGHSIYVWAEGTGTTSGSATSRITAPVSGGSGSGTTTNIP